MKLQLDWYDDAISAELCRQLQLITMRPLQIMVSSDDAVLTRFLVAGGFVCRRKCYEVEAGTEDYIGGQTDIPLIHAHEGERTYEQCCQMMFDYYVATHKAINPWTADFESFCEDMPMDVICAKVDGNIASLAFVEDNEIAYVCGTDKQHFADFAQCLAAAMLAKYETICFESDDCDWAAMVLKSMFKNQGETSFNTYILEMEIKKMIRLQKELKGRILDIGGGGEGIIGRLYQKQVVAIDNRQEELDEAPDAFEKVLMDATALQYGDAVFDHVTFFFTLMFMSADEQQQAILEAARVLKDGGDIHIWDCGIASAYPNPFCIDLEIQLPDEHISTTYGVGKLDTQDAASIAKLCADAGLVPAARIVERDYFYLIFKKQVSDSQELAQNRL